MADAAEKLNILSPETNHLTADDRYLTEINNLNGNREFDGSFSEDVLRDVSQNLMTAVQEAAMPYAVTTTSHEFLKNNETGEKTFIWLGKTAVQNAMSGYKFHQHEAAIKRVDIEVDEARYSTEQLRPEMARVFISPRMTRADASLEDARKEHLGDDDAVRVSWLEYDDTGNVANRVMQSLLARDIPYDAWVRMLRDDNNIFGKSIEVEDDGSALSVMKVHRQLELPISKLPNGPVDILRSVSQYIDDDKLRQKISQDIGNYLVDQSEMQNVAEQKAKEWLDFEIELANSLNQGAATGEVKRFVYGLQDYWSEVDLAEITKNQTQDGNLLFDRKMAIIVEKAKQNLLWSGAAVRVGNEKVSAQVDSQTLERIRHNEELINIARSNGMSYQHLESENNRLIAGKNIKVGGGCSGKSDTNFKVPGDNSDLGSNLDQQDTEDSKESWKWKQGVCRVKSCAKKTEVGPCNICRTCQHKFDKGEDPTKEPVLAKKLSNDSKEKEEMQFWKIVANNFGMDKVVELEKV
jgi:hypothetical protein